MTPKGQGSDAIIFEAPYLRNGARQTHGHNGPPIGSRLLRVEWPRDWVGRIITFNSWLNLLIKRQIFNIKNIPVYTTV